MNNKTGNLLYLLSVVLAFAWAVAFFGHQAGGAIHLLLVCAVMVACISIWDVSKLKPKRSKLN